MAALVALSRVHLILLLISNLFSSNDLVDLGLPLQGTPIELLVMVVVAYRQQPQPQ
jgi:hypothetical protein